MALDRSAFLGSKRRMEQIEVEALGGDCWVIALSGRDRLRFAPLLQATGQGQAQPDLYGEIMVAGVVDEDGNPLFQKADVPALSVLDGGMLDEVAGAILRVSGMLPESGEEAKNA